MANIAGPKELYRDKRQSQERCHVVAQEGHNGNLQVGHNLVVIHSLTEMASFKI